MSGRNTGIRNSYSLSDAMHAEVASFMRAELAAAGEVTETIDRWTQRQIVRQNIAKLELVLEDDDPVEHCYQNLIREIETEAESGVFLVRDDAESAMLRELVSESGVSGQLHSYVSEFAPTLFEELLARGSKRTEYAWTGIRARYLRARIDAAVSEIIMGFLLDSSESVMDISGALRALMYGYHESEVRRQYSLPRITGEHDRKHVAAMVTELAQRAGSYPQRTDLISKRAGLQYEVFPQR